ncbi:hypothetical protein [Chelativorans salis]|uniref:Uncharacterized protein n=1 Tax=Chelativorans salis TaxID=2978478 RepID=A0ABT2LV68_9HYPH|nr:hypothetical protein [Chelativorans sp. EGI FJ00035]MCT7377473.1 hypothetical protein [Chelativorans sp. EGI FJ00035]
MSEGPQDGRDNWVRVSNFGMGVLRVTLLFGSVAIALALILTPLLERRTHNSALFKPTVDRMTTGTVGNRDSAYTVRRSVLQPSPQAVCIIRADGTRRGAC